MTKEVKCFLGIGFERVRDKKQSLGVTLLLHLSVAKSHIVHVFMKRKSYIIDSFLSIDIH